MVILSPQFVLLACLCAALPLAHPAPVDAAHLHRHNHMEEHAHGFDSRQRSPNDSPTHSYDGKYHAHKAPERRAPELPPLLRHHRDKKADDYHSQDSHDGAHPKAPRSAFARSRYHRESAPHSRRSSIYVPGEHGNTYLVSGTQPRTWRNTRRNTNRQLSHIFDRRQADESNMVLGRIDIMGAAPSAGGTQRLASLTVDSNPIDWTSGQSSAKAFTLNASTTNQTQFIMLPTGDAPNLAGSFMKHVSLATEVFDASSAEMVAYCATYDPDPGSSSLLLMTPCTGTAQSMAPVHDVPDPCSGAADLASSWNGHQSQTFSYDASSGKIEPISARVGSANIDHSSADPSGCAGAKIKREITNSTMSGSSSTARPTSDPQQAQNVTLMYIVGALEVPASSSSTSNNASASMGQVPLFTTTITTTVVSTVTATGSVNRTNTPAQAAVSVSMSSMSSPAMPQSTTATSAPSIVTPVAPSRSSSTLSLPSSMLGVATSKAPANAAESLEVEIIGVKSPLAPSSSSTSSTTTTMVTKPTTAMTSSNSSVSPSLNAQAIASSIANAMTHPRGRVFRSGPSR